MRNNIPPIAEKVKFWEEQDKINQAVIPRLIEMNDSIKNLSTQLGEVDKKIAFSESRIQKNITTKLNSILFPKKYKILIYAALLIALVSLLITIFRVSLYEVIHFN